MTYWLMKSEPFVYSWDQLVRDKKGQWDGVRNHQATRNMKDMRVGDRAFFYHSNEGVEIVGVMAITRTAYADPTDATGKFVMVDVKPVQAAKKPLTLAAIKQDPRLENMQILKQSRLSVSKVTDDEARHILKLIGCGS